MKKTLLMREALTVWAALTLYHNAGHELTLVFHPRTSAYIPVKNKAVSGFSSQIKADEGYDQAC